MDKLAIALRSAGPPVPPSARAELPHSDAEPARALSPGGEIGRGCLSQWRVAPFVLPGTTFATAEHYMT